MKKSIFIIIFIFALLLRIGLISQKDGLFWDEIVNITTSNHVEYYQDRINYFKLNHPYTGKELKQLFLFDDKNDTLQDLKSLRNGTGDVLHTNFYYSVFRIFFHGVDDYNLNEYLIRAGLLNIILFGFSYFFMYKLLNMLFDDKKYVALGLFLAFCNPCAILNTIYFRLYQMQEMLFVMMAYLGVKNYNTSKKLTLKNVALWSLLTAMILLTGYYAMVYVGLVYLTIMLISRNKDTFKFLSVCAALSVLLVLLVYPSYLDFLIMTVFKPDSTHIATIETVAKTPLIAQIFNMFNYPLTIYKGICSQLLFLYFIIIGLMLCKRPICQSKAMWVITTISVVWGVIVLMTCPYKIIRYVLPVIPYAQLS
ncbi:hypothetical protein IJV79_04130 [bacterium]|nr:hypothetical protein [bacterium]